MGLFGVLASLLLGLALSTGKVTDDVRALSNINEESRLAVERLSRELRQAAEVTAVTLPAGATVRTALTFWTDFDGNGAKDLNAADPEILTYGWDPVTDKLSLTVNDASGTAITRPLLAANVSALTLDLRSSEWRFDTERRRDHVEGARRRRRGRQRQRRARRPGAAEARPHRRDVDRPRRPPRPDLHHPRRPPEPRLNHEHPSHAPEPLRRTARPRLGDDSHAHGHDPGHGAEHDDRCRDRSTTCSRRGARASRARR